MGLLASLVVGIVCVYTKGLRRIQGGHAPVRAPADRPKKCLNFLIFEKIYYKIYIEKHIFNIEIRY